MDRAFFHPIPFSVSNQPIIVVRHVRQTNGQYVTGIKFVDLEVAQFHMILLFL